MTLLVGLLRMAFEMWTLRSESGAGPAGDRSPSVDIVVVCGDEPLEVLRASLLACGAVRGDHRTIALDTLGRPELAEVTFEAGATHLVASAGPGRTPEEHLDAAMAHLTGDLVTVLHGNDVPLPNLIEELAGDFEDDTVWLAQGRQAVHGSSPEEYHGTPGQLAYFFSVLQPGKAHHQASYWCGSGGMLRRRAVIELGGIPRTTPTPGFQLSLRAHRHGWRSTYHETAVVLTLAGPGLRRFLSRRAAWARGIVGALRSPDSPLRPGGLSYAQRMSYPAPPRHTSVGHAGWWW
ncbi:MAG: glycosyltransferase [Microthrixaceae bacterium]